MYIAKGKEHSIVGLSKEDYIIKETLLESSTTVSNLTHLYVQYLDSDASGVESCQLAYDQVFRSNKETANLTSVELITNLKEKDNIFLVSMLDDILTYYLNNMLRHVAGLNIRVDSVLEDYVSLEQYAQTHGETETFKFGKILGIFSNFMFSLLFLNEKFKNTLKKYSLDNTITDSKTLVPYCIAVNTCICGIRGEFNLKSILNNLKKQYGFNQCPIPKDSPLFGYFDNIYESSCDFQDTKILDMVYVNKEERYSMTKFVLYRTLDKGYVIVFN